MRNLSSYMHPYYLNNYGLMKRAAQPPMDPSMMAGGGMPMDPSMMGGMPPGGMPMDPAMMGGGAPPMDPAMMGGMPADPSMMAGAPPMDPAAMSAAAPPPADPAAAAPADPATGKMSAKQQKEELMNGIQASLKDIKDYVYNNLMILIKVANALNVQIPAEALVSPPDGKNMDIMEDPGAISAAAGNGDMGIPGMGPAGPPPEMPPADQAPSEVKMSMFNMMNMPYEKTKSVRILMDRMVNKNRDRSIDQMSSWFNGGK